MHDAKGDADPASMDADEVPQARPDDRWHRLQGLGVDDRGHGIGRVMKAVNDFKSEGNEQGGEQQKQLPSAERVEYLKNFHRSNFS